MSDSFVTPWDVAHQAPLSMGSPRQKYWRGLPFPFPGDLPDPGMEPKSPALQADSLPLSQEVYLLTIYVNIDRQTSKHIQTCLIHSHRVPSMQLVNLTRRQGKQAFILAHQNYSITIAKRWKPSKCPSMDECMNEMYSTCTMEYYSALNRKRILKHGRTLKTLC